MSSVVFDPVAFKDAYPAFAQVSDAALTQCFKIACLYLSNDECSIVCNLEERKTLLWLLTAHIAYLNGLLNPNGMPGPVGRTASATEGSVSVSFDYPMNPNSAWFMQTGWGASFWQATAKYRAFRYRPRPTVY